MSHDEYRILVNNRAKRQLIRGIIKNNVFDLETKKNLIEAFKKLQFNDDKTNILIGKKLQLFVGNKSSTKKKIKNRKK